jgi:signal peptidase
MTTVLRSVVGRELVADVARRFGEVRLRVTGTSMLPSVWPGDILTVRRRSVAELLPGQIVLCYRDQEFVAHRLVGKRGDWIVTRGDSLACEDRRFRGEEVLGEVVSVVRDGRELTPYQNWWLRAGAWILRHSEPSIRILLRLRRQNRRQEATAGATGCETNDGPVS